VWTGRDFRGRGEISPHHRSLRVDLFSLNGKISLRTANSLCAISYAPATTYA